MNMSDPYTEELKGTIMGLGASLVGVADVEPLRQMELCPPNLLDPFHRAVSSSVVLPKGLFEQLDSRPMPTCCSVYPTANRFPGQIAPFTANVPKRSGCNSLPVPASQTLYRQNHCAAIPHRAESRWPRWDG